MKNYIYRALIILGLCIFEIVLAYIISIEKGTGWAILIGFVIWFINLGFFELYKNIANRSE